VPSRTNDAGSGTEIGVCNVKYNAKLGPFAVLHGGARLLAIEAAADRHQARHLLTVAGDGYFFAASDQVENMIGSDMSARVPRNVSRWGFSEN
jgi:hypothetical protein